MPLNQLQWVQESGEKESNSASLSKVRSQAMKDYRRRQRIEAVLTYRGLNMHALGPEAPEKLLNEHTTNDATSTIQDLVQSRHLLEPLLDPQGEPIDLHAGMQERILAYLRGTQAPYFLETRLNITVNDASRFRMRLVENCMATIFPHGEWESPSVGIIMSGWTNIKDAIALLNFGCTTGDERALMEGRKKHLVTVQILPQELQNPNTIWEEVLATALDLIYSELFMPVASLTGPDGLTRHLMGLSAILKWRDRRANLQTYGSWLSMLYSQLDLMHGLIHRRPMLLGKESLSFIPCTITPGSVYALVQIIGNLPEVLHTTDQMTTRVHSEAVNHAETPHRQRTPTDTQTSEPESQQTIRTTRYTLFTLEDNLFCWLLNFNPSPTILQACAATSPETHHEPLTFRDHNEGLTLNMYWVAKLLIAQQLVRLETLLKSTPKSDHNSEDKFAAEADRYAALLCRSVPSLSKTCGGHISKGLALRAPLYFAGRWYEASGYDAGLEWCREVEGQLREELTWLNWEALLPWSFLPMMWTGLGRDET